MEEERILNENEWLVKSIAKKYIGNGVPFEDLLHYGRYGLWIASEKFDESKGTKISTLATPWIKWEIEDYIAETKGISNYNSKRINKMKKVENELTQELKRDPTDKEVADRLEIPLEKLVELKTLSQQNISLESTIDSESDATLSDVIADNSMTPEEQTIDNENKKDIQLIKEAFFKTLYPHEKLIYTFKYKEEMNDTNIAKKLGVNRVKIKKIVENINNKLNDFYESDEYHNITNGKTDRLLKDIIEKQKRNIDISAKTEKIAKYEDYEKLEEKNFKDISTRFQEEYAINLRYPTFEEQFKNICEQKDITESMFCRATNLSEETFKYYKTKGAIPSIKAMVSFGIYFKLSSHTINALLDTAGYSFKKNNRTHLAYAFVLEKLNGYPIEYCNKVLELLGIEEKDFLNIYPQAKKKSKKKQEQQKN